MRLRAVIMLSLTVLLFDATWTRFAADPPPPGNYSAGGWVLPISGENTKCPVATHDLRGCPSIPPNEFVGYYLLIDEHLLSENGWKQSGMWGSVLGDLDLYSCSPYRLIRVRRLEKPPHGVFPPPCDGPAP